MLEGRLSEFGLADVFQLLALTRKTGVLRVTAATGGLVTFDEGAVAFAVADTRRLAFCARLVQRCTLTEAQLDRVVDAQRRGDVAAMSAGLLEDGALDEAALRDVLREQISDAVFGLMRLDDGGFSFDSRARTGAPLVTIPGDEVVAEGGRRLGEWERLRGRIGPPESVLALAPALTTEIVTLDAEQWRVLAHVDGARTAAELAELTGEGEFTTYRLLCALVEQGLVEVSGEGTTGSALTERRDTLRRLEDRTLERTAPRDPDPDASSPALDDEGDQLQAASAAGPSQPAMGPAHERLAALRRRLASPADPQSAASHVVVRPAFARPANGSANGSAADVQAGAQPNGTAVPANGPAVPPARAPSTLERSSTHAPSDELLSELALDGATPAPQAPHAEAPVPHVEAHGDGPAPAGEPTAAVGDAAAAAPADPPPAPAPLATVPYLATPAVDRASVARELAALGLDDEPAVPVRSSAEVTGEGPPSKRLTRDEAVSKGLLLRLINGVKGV